jgi:hypothetical protein
MTRRREQGKLTVRGIIALLFLALFGYFLFQVAPAMIDNYELQQTMRDVARTAVVHRKDSEEIRDVIWNKIRELRIPASPPIQREHVRVEWVGRSVTISVKYKVPVNLFVYKFDMPLNPEVSDRSL